jgi:formylglycine-generating enzyme required for sulfatase activity
MPALIAHPNVWNQAARDADLTLALPGGVPMFFRRIPTGRFRMGARGESFDEEPIHRVIVSQEFFLGTFVVTQEQYQAVATRCPALKKEADPSHFKGPRRPVEQVSWHDATAFCEWLTAWNGLPKGITAAHLPMEAEWEYACRGGTETEYYPGDGGAALAEAAWYDGNAGNETHPVDERAEAHPFGLHGMHGNVWEWCRDVFDANAFRKRADSWEAKEWTLEDAGNDAHYWSDEDREAAKNQTRVLRGGSWFVTARFCRSASRDWSWPDVRNWYFGFRVCLVRGPAAGRGAHSETAAEPAPGDGGRGTRPESDGAGRAGAALPDLASAKLPRVAGRTFTAP